MDLFMNNIAYPASELDITVALASILHKPPFPVDPLNFQVQLFTRNGKSRGIGKLTLPTREAGDAFLRSYGYSGISVKGRVIRFSLSNRPVDESIVRILNTTRWQDPLILERKKKRLAEESQPIELLSYAFGRFRRDGSFSSEVQVQGNAQIACDLDTRQVRFSLQSARTGTNDTSRPMDNLTSLFQGLFGDIRDLGEPPMISASYTPSKLIDLLSTRDSDAMYRLFVRAKAPPVFSIITTNSLTILLDSRTTAERLPGLGRNLSMPPGCHSLSLTFRSQADLDAFVDRCKRLGLHKSTRSSIPVHNADYSPEIMAKLDQFMSTLGFGLAFEVEKAVTNTVLTPSEILSIKAAIIALESDHGQFAAQIFRRFSTIIQDTATGRKRIRRNRRGKPVAPVPAIASLADQLKTAIQVFYAEQHRSRGLLEPSLEITDGVFLSYHLILTPTARVLEGPLPDQSNNVLRRFGNHECFLRVSFQDENGSQLRRDYDSSISELLKSRYRPILSNGCRLAGRSYDLLGYSMSGLREHSVWFVTPFSGASGESVNASEIRKKLGDFTPLSYQPARLAARWSQLFSTTDPTVRLKPDEISLIDDRKSAKGVVMTDGCGTISPELAKDIWDAIRKRRRAAGSKAVPSAFQFRLGGCKGVVVVDNTLRGKLACFRPSQTKFDSTDLAFDVQSTSARPKAMFLNRPLIVLLEHLGASSDHIISLQDDAIHEAQAVHSSFINASNMFQQHGLGSSFRLPSLFSNLEKILHLKVGNSALDSVGLRNELITSSLHCASTHALRELKYRAHIAVPNSFTLIGVSDEWACLREGEIYATARDERTGLYREITGRVAITRSPQIHPGDVQIVTAVRRPQLSHLTNVVVFSCEGDRPLSSCLGGGDMDGDDFNIIIDPALHPKKAVTPGAYTPLPIKKTSHACGISDVIDFIFDYIESDLVGLIAIAHLRHADIDGPASEACLKLAECASHAVDFPKTGTPVKFADLPRFTNRAKPDFLAREGAHLESDQYYNSKKLLGELYRRVPVKEWFPQPFNAGYSPSDGEVIARALKCLGLHRLGLPALDTPADELLEEMEYLLEAYSDQLLTIAKAHTIFKNKDIYVSEAELLSGTIMANWSDHRRRREAVTAMNLQTHELVRGVRDALRATDYDAPDDDDYYEDEDGYYVEEDYGDESGIMKETFRRAWAAWYVAEESLAEDPTWFGAQSFGLIALGRMLEIVKEVQF
ncbi:RdRP-domain-containing protein [Leucogyrophana mollusca]|uniref:RdRP-domain-containing protein n=1 Tax=Leucogyrophana mollusca TaxID=85980 RepID=A0ACB8BYC3_9AGAM|nr:RdRP-domain-containing protein [Leucogyrophana mollusca]